MLRYHSPWLTREVVDFDKMLVEGRKDRPGGREDGERSEEEEEEEGWEGR